MYFAGLSDSRDYYQKFSLANLSLNFNTFRFNKQPPALLNTMDPYML